MITSRFHKTIKIFNPKLHWREILAVLMVLFAIVFFRSERKELSVILPQLRAANTLWLAMGFVLTIIYFLLQGGMYIKSFAAIGLRIPWGTSVMLFLKRNFVSVFLPAGGVSALAYSPSQIRKAGFTKMQVHQASGLFGIAGLLTVMIAGVPVIIYTITSTHLFKHSWVALIPLLLLLTLLVTVAKSLQAKGKIYYWVDKKFPKLTSTINELFAANVHFNKFSGAVIFSLGVELCGMLHIYIAMLALGLHASFGAAASAYILAVLMMIVSPFLRGLGAVELSMVFVLQQFGYSSAQALSITVLYRVFEFWLPLLAGLISFSWSGRKIFFRLAPAILTFMLGIVNIISVVTSPLHNRLQVLRDYVPLTAIHASNLMVLFIGLSLLVTASFLFRGLRNAWRIAIALSLFSAIGHLTKALDYEEAVIAIATVVVLMATASEYSIRSNSRLIGVGLKTAGLSMLAVLLFGFTSFYFIDIKHFGIDFTWQQSILHTLKIFLLVDDATLHPLTKFGHEYTWMIKSLGFITWSFLLFTLIKPHLKKYSYSNNYTDKAKFLLSQFGNSSTDYFKLYKDKLYFFSDVHEAFVAYRIANGFAVVLDEPVCAQEDKMEVIAEFDMHCRKMGLKPAFYRVDENSIPWFSQLKKQKLLIGQEAILNIESFSLEGKEKKSLRNGLNSLKKQGYVVSIQYPPHDAGFLSKLKSVSDEWLTGYHKEELVFSQGMFDEKELQQQVIIQLSDAAGNIKSFLNIIHDYAADECTYDLIRKTNDAPGAAMDALIIQLIEYAKEKKQLYLNLGMVPMTGLNQPGNAAEHIIKLAAAKIKRFQHYKGLREFKEKYATVWENKYLVYDNDFDLLKLPIALNAVMKI